MKTQQVRSFFNKVASDYPKRYDPKNVFLHFLHSERLHFAVEGLALDGTRVLDVGAGTGQLYDYLTAQFVSVDYMACDIAEAMQTYSNVPENQYKIGTLETLAFEQESFDYVFMLGVTSYLSKSDFQKHIEEVQKILKPGGVFIVTFTHRASLDYRIRGLANRVMPRSWMKNRLVGQAFQTQAYTPEEVNPMFQEGFEQRAFLWLNQTVSPFNRLFPKLSIRLARPAYKKKKRTLLNRLGSGDFLLKLEKC